MFNEEQIESLTKLELDVYHYVSKHADKVLDMRIRDLAQEVHVSTTVILQFCKKVGCNGWTEFKSKYKMATLHEVEKSNLQDMKPVLDYLQLEHKNEKKQTELQKVIRLIDEAKKIIFIGGGLSGMFANYGATYLAAIGKETACIDSTFIPIADEDYSETIVIAISVSGETQKIIQQVLCFKKCKARIISITHTEENTLAKMATISIAYSIPLEDFYTAKAIEQINTEMPTQIPVIYLLEVMGKQLQKILSEKKIPILSSEKS